MATIETAPASAPTPDHPPYSWMIGEAIDALRGSATEDVISAFIIGRHRGVPPAHDRVLRHYLAKHVAEGLFCAAQGRYSRGSAQVTVAKLSPEHGRQPPELALVVANDGDPPCPATAPDHDQTCTTAADGTKDEMSRRRPHNAAPVHTPATASNANVKMKKKKARQHKVQDLYDRNAVLPADSEMWCVLALPAPVKR